MIVTYIWKIIIKFKRLSYEYIVSRSSDLVQPADNSWRTYILRSSSSKMTVIFSMLIVESAGGDGGDEDH